MFVWGTRFCYHQDDRARRVPRLQFEWILQSVPNLNIFVHLTGQEEKDLDCQEIWYLAGCRHSRDLSLSLLFVSKISEKSFLKVLINSNSTEDCKKGSRGRLPPWRGTLLTVNTFFSSWNPTKTQQLDPLSHKEHLWKYCIEHSNAVQAMKHNVDCRLQLSLAAFKASMSMDRVRSLSGKIGQDPAPYTSMNLILSLETLPLNSHLRPIER